MKHSRTAMWVSTGAVALVLLLVPGATTKPEQPATAEIDLSADLGPSGVASRSARR
ncbi:hypothetical protein ACWED2_09655 [Amycolatopsis sp. NPDC005003]